MDNQPKYITEEGYRKLRAKLEELNEKIKKETGTLAGLMREAEGKKIDSAVASCRVRIDTLNQNLKEIKQELSVVKIKEIDKDATSEIAEVNDTVVVKIIYDENDTEEVSFVLVDADPKDDELLITSPLGQAIYHQPVNTEVSYAIPESNITIIAVILNITKPNQKQR